MKLLHPASLVLGAILVLGISTMSHSSAQSTNHVYELRTYHASAGKLEDLKNRFRDHTITVFNRYHMKSIGYWIPQDNKDYVLIYILEHASRADADKNWASFNADPEWQKAKAASEANGKIVDKVDRVFMDPADFSALK
jgi:hypothetical protein